MAGFEVPADTPILVVELTGVGKQHPLSAEKLSPVLSLYIVKDFAGGLDICESLLRFGGLGHTCVIHSNDDARIREYGLRMPAFRVLVNTSSPQGSTGITTNVFPSMTLGCGAMAGNITSDNIGPLHLINIKRIAYVVRKAADAFEVPAPAARAVAASGSVDRGAVVAAVEKYLAGRGMSTNSAPVKSPVSDVVASVVDRFLAARKTPPAPPSPPQSAPPPSAPPHPAPPQKAPEPEPAIVPFVCESDVREAIRESRKIYVGPKTIITPSARDVGDQFGILVLAQR
jgi:acetaldehyde dehydrogenase (acetylating)